MFFSSLPSSSSSHISLFTDLLLKLLHLSSSKNINFLIKEKKTELILHQNWHRIDVALLAQEAQAVKVTGKSWETTKMQFPDLKSLRNLFLPCQAMTTLQVLSGSSERLRCLYGSKWPGLLPKGKAHTEKVLTANLWAALAVHCSAKQPSISLVYLCCWVRGISRSSAVVQGSQLGLVPN